MINEQDRADGFWRWLDAGVGRAWAAENSEAPDLDGPDLHFVRELLACDFSSVETGARHRLRRRLLAPQAKETIVQSLNLDRRPCVVLSAALALALAVTAAVWPAAPAAIAQEIGQIVRSIVVGPHTSMEQVAVPEPAAARVAQGRVSMKPVVSVKDGTVIVQTALGAIGGNVPEGRDATVRQVASVAEAQALVPFLVRQPTGLPAGYALSDALVTPWDDVILVYHGPGSDIVLAQTGIVDKVEGNTATISRNVASTGSAAQEVTLEGRPAAWAQDSELVWESGGVSYMLGSPGMGLDETLSIAGSLK